MAGEGEGAGARSEISLWATVADFWVNQEISIKSLQEFTADYLADHEVPARFLSLIGTLDYGATVEANKDAVTEAFKKEKAKMKKSQQKKNKKVKAAAQRVVLEQAEAERVALEQAAAQRAALEQAEAERVAAEQREAVHAEYRLKMTRASECCTSSDVHNENRFKGCNLGGEHITENQISMRIYYECLVSENLITR